MGSPVARCTTRPRSHVEVVGAGEQQPGPVGELAVLEPGGAGRAAGEQRRAGPGPRPGEHGASAARSKRGGRVQHRRGPRQVGHDGVHQRADRDRVGDAAGVADVVLQHPPAAVLVAHEVEALDRARGPRRRGSRVACASQPGRPEHGVAGQHAVGEDPLLAVDVAQERLDRPGALHEAGLAAAATRAGRIDPRHEVDVERLLHAALRRRSRRPVPRAPSASRRPRRAATPVGPSPRTCSMTSR